MLVSSHGTFDPSLENHKSLIMRMGVFGLPAYINSHISAFWHELNSCQFKYDGQMPLFIHSLTCFIHLALFVLDKVWSVNSKCGMFQSNTQFTPEKYKHYGWLWKSTLKKCHCYCDDKILVSQFFFSIFLWKISLAARERKCSMDCMLKSMSFSNLGWVLMCNDFPSPRVF